MRPVALNAFAQLLTVEWFILVLFAYLLGSISTAILTCKLLGKTDPRSEGSRNPGATNVLRVAGKTAAIITLIGDFAKGLIPVLLAHNLSQAGLGLFLIGFAAFLGHLYPVFFGFKGGKGVATGLGSILAFDWRIGLIMLGIWLFVAKGLKISSLSALTAFLLLPLLGWYFGFSTEVMIAMAIMTLMIFWRHRGNIERLLKGQER